MRRRRFIQLAGLMAFGALLSSPLNVFAGAHRPQVTDVAGVLFRADRRGRIYVSKNKGATWELHTNLGSNYSVSRLGLDRRGRVAAMIRFRGRHFGLVLDAEGKRWLTA